jgi:hypothetical protein
MATTQGFVFEERALSLIADIVEAAIGDADNQNIALPKDRQEARKLLAGRIVRAIEAGETDMDRLREIALVPDFRGVGTFTTIKQE